MSRWSLIRQWGKLRYPRLARWVKFVWMILLVGSYGPPEPEPNLVALTQEVWTKRLGRPVPEDEALEIIRSFRNLFFVLKEVKGAVQH